MELEQITLRLRDDAIGRSAGSRRDDLVVLAIRSRAASDAAAPARELALGQPAA